MGIGALALGLLLGSIPVAKAAIQGGIREATAGKEIDHPTKAAYFARDMNLFNPYGWISLRDPYVENPNPSVQGATLAGNITGATLSTAILFAVGYGVGGYKEGTIAHNRDIQRRQADAQKVIVNSPSNAGLYALLAAQSGQKLIPGNVDTGVTVNIDEGNTITEQGLTDEEIAEWLAS